jgi:hypothetical protein
MPTLLAIGNAYIFRAAQYAKAATWGMRGQKKKMRFSGLKRGQLDAINGIR